VTFDETMKKLYTVTFALGLWLAIASQLYTFALPKNALVAGILINNPTNWNITLNPEPATDAIFSSSIAKTVILDALSSPVKFDSSIRLDYLQAGIIIMIFSGMGLLRERRVRREKRIEHAPPAGRGEAPRP